MGKLKRIMALIMAAAVVLSYQPTFSNAAAKVSKKGYTISKTPGTYSDTVSVKITAKKGYKVYYSLNGTLTVSKIIKSKKSKTLTIATTKVLTVYAVKSNKKVTKKLLKKSSTLKKAATYQYIIADSTENETDISEISSTEVSSTETKITEALVTEADKTTEATTEVITTTEDVLKITEAGDYTVTGTYKKISIKANANVTLNNVTVASSSVNIVWFLPFTYI
ncbi:MAG: hypothetical protein K5656_10140 [Lachnospiraceae bacterium]|nr:hypothetical protein [Lachnospiraceae bacterium]